MDRLTTRAKDQQGNKTHTVWYNPYAIDEVECIIPSSDKEKRALEKLSAYEDTGLTPEEVLQLKGECFGWKVDAEKYKAAETEGRLVVLPCKVGDMVWSGEPFVDKRIREGVIVQINVDAFGFCGFWASFHPSAIAAEFIKEDIGETVFFTSEEAEEAIKEAHNGE